MILWQSFLILGLLLLGYWYDFFLFVVPVCFFWGAKGASRLRFLVLLPNRRMMFGLLKFSGDEFMPNIGNCELIFQ